MSNVINFTGATHLDIDPEKVIDAAKDHGLNHVIILGYDYSGDEYFASSCASAERMLWLLERMKKSLLETPDDI